MNNLKKSKYFDGFVFKGKFTLSIDDIEMLEVAQKLVDYNIYDAYAELMYVLMDLSINDTYKNESEIIELKKYQSFFSKYNLFCEDYLIEIINSISIYENNLKIWNDIKNSIPRIEAQKYIGRKYIRDEVFKLHGKKCLKCGTTKDLSIDHIKPIYLGGKNEIENLQPLCRSCNSSKGIKDIDYRKNN